MDLLLTHGYFLYEDEKELQIMKPYAPLGILYLTSHLRARGIDVEVFDTTFADRGELLGVLDANTPAVLGVYSNLMTRGSVVRILRAAREAGWKTVVGGPESDAYAEEYLRAGADAIVIGEGEVTLEELVRVLPSGGPLGSVRGIAYLEAGQVCRTPARPQIRDLDAQPWPSRESVNIERYIETWRTHHGAGSVSMITARGCPYECRWCSRAVYGKTHRRRSPASVAGELEWILGRYAPDMMWIADDVFTIHHGWLKDYAALVKNRGLRIPFECISRADRIDGETASRLAELGCFRIWIGSESGSQRILDAMDRGVRVDQIRRSVELCKAQGIQTGMFLMWGYEGEELDDVQATVDHVKLTRPDVFLTTVAYPIRGTPYYADVEAKVASSVPWAEGSDRDFKLRGRRSREFYKGADLLLRAEVELDGRERGAIASTAAEIAAVRTRIREARDRMAAASGDVEA